MLESNSRYSYIPLVIGAGDVIEHIADSPRSRAAGPFAPAQCEPAPNSKRGLASSGNYQVRAARFLRRGVTTNDACPKKNYSGIGNTGRERINPGIEAEGSPMRCTSVVIADSHPVVVRGLTSVLEARNGFKVVACCNDGPNCIAAIRSLVPDIAILDVAMPGLSGLEILAIANSESLSTRLVFFTASAEDRELILSAAARAYGVLLKDMELEILVRSLRQIADGQRLLTLPSFDKAVPPERENIAIAENEPTVLTDRERQIMALVSEGLSNKEMGRRLNIADGTIKVHLHHIYRKLEISNRTLLAALAISNNGSEILTTGNPVPRVRLGEQGSS
jgi:two-component system nitrate/nitrite response regulator NarL